MTPEPPLQRHLTTAELRERYRRCAHAADRTRWHGLWLVAQGKSHREVARLVDRSHSWVNRLVRAYNAGGPDAVATHKRAGESRGGKPAALDATSVKLLEHALDGGAPPGGGKWTGAKVARWIETKTGHRPDQATGWRYLNKLGYSKKTSRPAHPEAASREEQVGYQKKSSP